MIIRHQWEITVWYIVSIIVIVGLTYFFTSLIITYGDDTEDKGKNWIDTMLQRVEEWNRQTAINETLQVAERFNCDYDESLCVLGTPDPDFYDIGICFNSPELAEQYYKQTGINGTVPCPDFSISGIPKDESGK